jgi:hypothetical protein
VRLGPILISGYFTLSKPANGDSDECFTIRQ